MKRVLWISALVLLFSVSAYGQANAKGGSVGSQAPSTNSSGGGGNGGGLNGSGGRLPAYPRAHFDMREISGAGDSSFAPSTFMTYDQAVAAGKVAGITPKTLAEVAAESSSTPKAKSKFTFVQDSNGRVVSVPQK